MKDGFVKVAAITPEVCVADVTSNVIEIKSYMEESQRLQAKVVVFPELVLTGYSCRDLFYQDRLLQQAKEGLLELAAASRGKDAVFFLGLPLAHRGKLYNVAAVLHQGRILGLVPKTYLPTYQEFYEGRQFTPGRAAVEEVALTEEIRVPMGTHQLFVCSSMPELVIGVEICEDLWTPQPPGISHCMHGATVMVNLSASDELTGKSDYRRQLVRGQSGQLYCGYIYASAGAGESTQDVVYGGHDLIAESGQLLEESSLFTTGCILSELDVKQITAKRRSMSTFAILPQEDYVFTEFSLEMSHTGITRWIDPAPFVPGKKASLDQRCREILDIQSMGLVKRLAHTGAKTVVLGISGGLDSTLALLVTVRAFDLLSLDRKGILAVTMPGFGTTDRTYGNAMAMMETLGVSIRTIPIAAAVRGHFADIGQEEAVHDITYENCQARERTQILMDLANKEKGLVIGTGDMSELALGWATYNGDHMSMYGVNVSVPKTLVRHLVRYYADHTEKKALREVLLDVLDTPVSPELLPPEQGIIAQKTEELVGPYELHDFFLYHLMRYGSEPCKIFRLASIAFRDVYDEDTILKWEKVFYRRFFAQQFKRSCLPDGPKVGTVSLSPRGDLRMPSDASARIWMEQLEMLERERSVTVHSPA
jgi:NAD+ synthase (glutamine-hydrolysing)